MPDRRGQLERLRQRPVFEPRATTVGAGLVPALCLPINGRQTVSATAVMNAPSDHSHPKCELHPFFPLLSACQRTPTPNS